MDWGDRVPGLPDFAIFFWSWQLEKNLNYSISIALFKHDYDL